MTLAKYFLLAMLALIGLGCASEYPPLSIGDVRGTIYSDGVDVAGTPNPVLVVGAFAFDPRFLDRISAGEKPVPHAAFFVPNPVFPPEGIPYFLSNLDPYDKGYFVTAVLLDMMDAAAAPGATGLFPDMGILTSKPDTGPVQVVAGYTRTNVDIVLTNVAAP